MTDWTDPNEFVTPHFTVRDCLWLHAWERLASEKDGVFLHKIVALCQKLEQVRALLDCPLNVHSMFRSIAYNRNQNINPVNDVHSDSCAVDFDASPTFTIEEVKDKLRPLLSKLNVRMERATPTWVHLDLRMPGPSGREFTP